MGIEVIVESSEGESAAFALLDALNAEDEGTARLRPGKPRAGTLGGPVQTIELLLTSGAFAGAAAKVLVTWLRTRTSTTKVTLKSKDDETFTVEQTGTSPEAFERLLRQVTEFVERDGTDRPQ